MNNSHVFEAVNALTGQPVAVFLNRTDAQDFIGMQNTMARRVMYRIHAIHIANNPFPSNLVR